MAKSVFISGPITGVERYYEAFEAAMDELSAAGFIPLTPSWQPAGLTNTQYMRICLAMIDSADAVLFLPNWSLSKGARLERMYCNYTEKPYADTLDELKEVLSKMSNQKPNLPKVCDLHLEVYNSPEAENFCTRSSVEFHGSEMDEACVLRAVFGVLDMDFSEALRVTTEALRMVKAEEETNDDED